MLERMSKVHYGVCMLLWIVFLVECKIPEARVTCIFSEGCVLPCSLSSGDAVASVQWYQQESLIFSFQRGGESLSNGNARLVDQRAADGNATLFLNHVDIKHKGRYRCVVNNTLQTHVVVAVEAPIRMISIDTNSSRLIQCSTKDVYPSPTLQWTTEPSSNPASLQPVTRMFSDENGLYSVESVVKQHNTTFDHTYVCNITSKYGTQTWTASLKLQEIFGTEGKNLLIPCRAPKNLQLSTLVWTYTKANKTTEVLKYDIQTHETSRFLNHVELENNKASKGDGSLTLENPVGSDHSGIYTCMFSGENSRYRIETSVNFTPPRHVKESVKYNLWMLGIVVALLALFAITLLIKRYKAKSKKTQESSPGDEEMQSMNTAKPLEEPEAENKITPQPSSSRT